MRTFNTSLWRDNHPRLFWQCQPDFLDDIWETAIARAMQVLSLPETMQSDLTLELTLDEEQFGPERHHLEFLCPLLPTQLTLSPHFDPSHATGIQPIQGSGFHVESACETTVCSIPLGSTSQGHSALLHAELNAVDFLAGRLRLYFIQAASSKSLMNKMRVKQK